MASQRRRTSRGDDGGGEGGGSDVATESISSKLNSFEAATLLFVNMTESDAKDDLKIERDFAN